MVLTERLEQRVTGRADSYVPGRTMLRLMGRREGSQPPVAANLAMHFGTAAALGALRGLWACAGLRGASWSAVHTVVRLATDQTLENATGAGAPPQTWPVQERWVDVGHKAVYAFATGWLTDRSVRPALRPLPGAVSH